MGSFRAGIGIKECPKCDSNCIVDVWDRDYDGIRESYYCHKCNSKSTSSFIREYINGKIQSRAYNLMNNIDENLREENLANAIITILRYDYNNYESNELMQKIKGMEEFKLERFFDFKKVREIVRKNLTEDENNDSK